MRVAYVFLDAKMMDRLFYLYGSEPNGIRPKLKGRRLGFSGHRVQLERPGWGDVPEGKAIFKVFFSKIGEDGELDSQLFNLVDLPIYQMWETFESKE